MADIRLAKPAAGVSESVQCAPEARFVFDFPTTDATLARDGDNLNIRFEDGSNLQLEGFYQQYNEENLPSFNIDGTEVAAADFFQAMNEPDLMPAAGPGTGTVANGARFHEWGDSSLTGGITHLNGLDWGFSRNFEWDDVPNAVGRNGDDWGWWAGASNNPVTLTPEDPSPVPPGTTVPGDDPENPTPPTPGNHGIVPPGDVRLVDEAGLRDGDSVSVNGAMRVSAPDGLASIEVAGRVIWQNGHMVGDPQFATDEGYFHNFAYDAASGRLTYTYTLTEATQEHGQPGADHIAHSLPLTVRDVDGDAASSNITIIIRDDTPDAANDYAKAVEGHTIDGNVLINDTPGADGEGAFSAGRTVRWDVPEGTEEKTEGGRHSYELRLSDGTKEYGTVTLYDDGSYSLKASSSAKSDDWEGKTSFSAPAIGYSIVDADGDIARATLNLEVIRSQPGITPGKDPDPENPDNPGDPTTPAVEVGRIVVDEGTQPQEAHEQAHDKSGKGSFNVRLNGETEECSIVLKGAEGAVTIEFDADGNPVIDGKPIDADSTGASLTVTGVEITVTEVEKIDDDNWSVSYEYKLTEQQDHWATDEDGNYIKDDEGKPQDATTLGGQIVITVKDTSGDTKEGVLKVEVHDDVPVVEVAENTVSVSMGADDKYDGDASEYASVMVYAKVNGEDKLLEWRPNGKGDGAPEEGATPSLYNAEKGDYTAAIPGVSGATVKVHVDEDGNLRFTLSSDDGKDHNVDLTVKATDADGDVDAAPVSLSTPSVTPRIPTTADGSLKSEDATIQVSDGSLEGSSGKHNTGYGTEGKGSVTLEVHDEAGGQCDVTLSCNGQTLSLHLEGTEADLSGNTLETENGVTVTFTEATYKVSTDENGQKSGQWELKYDYKLEESQKTHVKGDASKDDVLEDRIAVTVKDASGDEATGTVNVKVFDDEPEWTVAWKGDKDAQMLDVEVRGEPSLTSLNGDYNTHIVFHTDTAGATRGLFKDIGLTQTYTARPVIETIDGGTFWWGRTAGPNDTAPTYIATTDKGDIEIIPTFVHYKYVETGTDNAEGKYEPIRDSGQVTVDHMVDVTNALPRSGKALYLTGEGLTVGVKMEGVYDGKTYAWNGKGTVLDEDGNPLRDANGNLLTLPGGIAVGSGQMGTDNNHLYGENNGGVKNYTDAYGKEYPGKGGIEVDEDNISEAVVFDTHNGLISYGFDIGLGMGDGDRVLVTFLMTPANSSDDSIVKMVEITQDGCSDPTVQIVKIPDPDNGDREVYRIHVADGFTKVFVSALPKQTYEVVDDGFTTRRTEDSPAEDTSGFVIKEVDFLTETYTSSGTVEAISADGVSYDWNFDETLPEGSKVFVKGDKGGEYEVTITRTHPAGDGSEHMVIYTATYKVAGDDRPHTLFTAEMNTETGKWEVTRYREFDMVDSDCPNAFMVKCIDGDGDETTGFLDISAHFMRFTNVVDGYYDNDWGKTQIVTKDTADDILVGTDDNTLMYGKGGDDLLIGDNYDKDKPINSGNSDVNKALKTILESTTERNLNHVTSTGGETSEGSKVDTLYDIISNEGFSVDAKLLLGKELEEREQGTHGDDALYGGRGDDLLFGAGGDDYLSGDLGKDIIYGGKGNDIILYDKEDLYIDGGDGKDILIGGKNTPGLAELLANKGLDTENGPVVRKVEMLLKSESEFTSSLEISSHKSLRENYGITITKDGVELSGDWTKNEADSNEKIAVYENSNNRNKLTLEVDITNVTVKELSHSPSTTARAAGIAGEVGLLTALAAANGVEAAPVREDDADAAVQEAQASDSGLDAAAVAYAEAEANAPEDAQPGAEPRDGFESLIADLGEVTPAMLDGAAEVQDASYTAMDGDSEAQAVASAADGAPVRTAGEGASGGVEAHGDLPYGVEVIREGDGDDFIDAGEGSHAIYAGAGDDLIVYDATDYLIDGGDGIDFLLSGSADPAHSLADMLGNWEHKGADTDMPMVHDVEVMLKGVDTSLQNLDSLAREYGFSMDKDANGRDILVLDKGKWALDESQSGNGTNTYVNAENGITLETTLAEVGNTGTDAGEQAAQTIVLANNG